MSSLERDDDPEPPEPAGARGLPQFPRYDVREVLGEGATSVVYSAWDKELKRPVAIKLLRETSVLSSLARQRFRREAEAAAGMAHPNVVTLYDAGEQDGRPYLVLELVEGKSFSEMLLKSPGFRREHVELLAKAARGIGAVHAKGIVHRDLKPGNILVTASGEPKIGDFGLVHLQGTTMELTRTGATLGTPFYMAPEQVESKPGQITPRTDIYGLGAILYEILTGQAPHLGESLVEIYKKVLQDDPVRIRTLVPDVSPDLEAIALKALSKDPARRYASGDEFADDLERYLSGRAVRAKPPSFAGELRKTWLRNRAVFVAAGTGLVVAIAVAALLVPRWLAEKKGRESSESSFDARAKSLQDLLALWSDVIIAKQGWYQAQKDPRQTRSQIERAVDALSGFIASHPDEARGYYVRARAYHYLDDLERARADLKKVTSLEPKFGPAWALLGRLYIEEMWETSLRNHTYEDPNLDESAALLKLATESFAKAPLSAEGQKGLDRMDEEAAAAPMARALLIAFSENNLPKAKAALLEIHRASPSEELALLLGQLSSLMTERLSWSTEALRIRPHYFKALFNRGTYKDSTNDLAGAEADYTEALKINPRHAITYFNRSVVREKRGNRAGSLEDVAETLRLKPGFAPAYDQRGVLLLKLRDLPGALKAEDEAIRLQPKLFTSWSNRAYIKSDMGDNAAALVDATRAHELAPRFANALVVRAMIRHRLGETQGAIDDATAAILISPTDGAAFLQRGLARFGRAEHAAAMKDLSECIRLIPDQADGFNSRAALRLLVGEDKAAFEDADRAVALDPNGAAGYANRALAGIRLSRYEGALQDATQCLKLDPKNANAFAFRALARANLGDLRGALGDADTAVTLTPQHAEYRTNRAEIRSRLGDYRGAIEDATEAIRLNPRSSQAYANRAAARMSLGEFEEGIEDSTEALKLNPQDAMSYCNRSGARGRLRDYAGSIEDATKAIAINPTLAQAYQYRALACWRLEKWASTVADCGAGLKLAPANVDLLYYRGLAEEKLAGEDPAQAPKHLESARRDFEKSLQAAAGWPYRAEAEAALRRLRDKK